MTADDSGLLADAQRGDLDALRELLARNEARIYRFGAKMCRNDEDAKDVLQETLLAVARGIREFRGASSLSTWLYKIARSHCIKRRRRSKYAPAELAAVDERLPSPAASPEENAASRQTRRALDDAIAALEPKYREVLLLRDVEGLTAPEVAEVLGLTVEAVKSRLHRARLSVRARVAPALGLDVPPADPSCPDVLALFSANLEGDVSAQRCASMQAHVEQCARCRNACESLKQTLSLCNAAGEDEVPRAVQDAVRYEVKKLLGAPSQLEPE